VSELCDHPFCSGSGTDHELLPYTHSKLLVVTLESQQAIVVDLRRRRRAIRGATQINGINGDHANGIGHESVPSSSKAAHEPWQTAEVRMDLGDIFEQDRRTEGEKEGESTSLDT
jgi:hypothetical protein